MLAPEEGSIDAPIASDTSQLERVCFIEKRTRSELNVFFLRETDNFQPYLYLSELGI